MTIWVADGDRVLTSQQTLGRGMGRMGPQPGDESAITVGRDGPGNWYVPLSAGDFTQLGLNTPNVLLLCQESSGSLVPTIDSPGAGNWAINGTGQLYQQSVTGWTRKFVGLNGAVNAQRFGTVASQLDVASGESFAMICYAAYTTPGASRGLFAAQGANNRVQALSTGVLRTIHNATQTNTPTSHAGITTVHQIAWYRRADTNVSGLQTDIEGITSNPHNESAFAGQIKCLGSTEAATPAVESRFCWCAIYKGVNAEFAMSTYLQTLRG